ncbi:MAG: hypothetical protein IBJ12_13455 [Sphingomonadaceae bacterium]|nr:hypothetical protein [Sphingomonadaceae bacterium]
MMKYPDIDAYNAGLAAIAHADPAPIPSLLAAAQRRANDASYWQILGLLQRACGESAAALQSLERAAHLAPGNFKIAHAVALVRLEAGLPAVESFDRVVALATEPEEALQGLAAAMVADGRRTEAVAKLDEALASRPHWFDGHWLACRLRWMDGERYDYLASIDKALTQHPRDLQLWQMRILVDQRSANFTGVLQSVERGRKNAGQQPLFDFFEICALSELGDHQKVDADFGRFAIPTDLSALIPMVRHEIRMGRPERAIEQAQPALGGAAAIYLWPYVAISWRMMDHEQWHWLEGDDRLCSVLDLADRLPDLERLAERLRSIHAISGLPVEQSVRNGTQTDGPLLARLEPEIVELRKVLVDAIKSHLAQLPPIDPTHPILSVRRTAPISFNGAWSVRLTGAGHHVSHVHPAGWFSSALYISVPSGDEIGSPPSGWLALGEPEPALRTGLAPLRLVEPRPGRLVLFPSTLWHSTRPFESGERMSAAFDVARPA